MLEKCYAFRSTLKLHKNIMYNHDIINISSIIQRNETKKVFHLVENITSKLNNIALYNKAFL